MDINSLTNCTLKCGLNYVVAVEPNGRKREVRDNETLYLV